MLSLRLQLLSKLPSLRQHNQHLPSLSLLELTKVLRIEKHVFRLKELQFSKSAVRLASKS